MTLELCSKELSMEFKKAGFDWPVRNFYHPIYVGVQRHSGGEDNGDDYNRNSWANGYCSAPSLALAAVWLRSKGLHVAVSSNAEQSQWISCLQSKGIYEPIPVVEKESAVSSHDLALSAGIQKALTILKEGI